MLWNVDGSSRGKLGLAGIGGVFRDDQGEIKAFFSVSVGMKDSNVAQVLAIVYASECPYKKSGLRIGRLS